MFIHILPYNSMQTSATTSNVYSGQNHVLAVTILKQSLTESSGELSISRDMWNSRCPLILRNALW